MSEATGLQILVVDDNRSAAEAAAMLLERDGHCVSVCFSGADAIERLEQGDIELVVTDLRMEPVDGLEVVRAARKMTPPVDAIVMTAYGSVEAAVEAMRLGAVDFLTKPLTADQLIQRVRDYRGAQDTPPALIGESDIWAALQEQVVRLARVYSTVLLVGETGTGRRHLARWLHHNGPDHAQELLRIQPGRPVDPAAMQRAGTLLLVGVDTWPHSTQQAILRQLEALEPGRPPRVVATAGPRVEDAVASGELLPELYFRLAVLVLRIPLLRDRPRDVAPLLDHFLRASSRILGRPVPEVSPSIIDGLQRHSWPGNVRELANLAERACVLGPGALRLVALRDSTGGNLDRGGLQPLRT